MGPTAGPVRKGARLTSPGRPVLERLASLWIDLRLACRTLKRSPAFAAIVVLTLGTAIGVNTAVFTITNAVLFKGFRGIERNGRILYIGTQRLGRGCCASFPDFVDWRARAHSFTDLAAVADLQIVAADESRPAEHYDATRISANGFRLLGRRPILGRDFTPADDAAGAAPVAILQYTFWQRRYGKDPTVLGRTMTINGTPTTIVGVMPEGFSFPQNEDLWLPLVPTPDLKRRDNRALWFVFGRLADGATFDTARAELAAIGAGLSAAYPATNDGWIPQPRTFAQFFVGRDAVAVYGVLWGAVGFVVLLACANLANLVLSRGLDRTREWAVRAALGASRWQIARQPLLESVILSALGGSLGWWIARLAVTGYAMTANPPARAWSANLFDYRMDDQVLRYVLLITSTTIVLVGLWPSICLSRVSAATTLESGGRTMAGGRRNRRLSTMLVVGQVAIALVLVVGAGLMVRSFVSMARADLGVRTANVDAMLVSVPRQRYADGLSQVQFFDRLASRLGGQPEVRAVALADELPAATGRRVGYEVDGNPAADPERRDTVAAFTISAGYFDLLSAKIVAGRDFNRFDTESGAPVAIVNQKLADVLWRGTDPLGRRLRVVDGPIPGPWLTVVGISSNIVQNMTDRTAHDPVLYRPYSQHPASSLWVLARTRSDARTVARVCRDSIDAIDRNVPIWIGPLTLDALIAAMGNYWLLGNQTAIFSLFGAIALFLASLGVYAVVAYSVTRRTKEFGIRIAIGASGGDVMRLVLRENTTPVVLGCSLGVAAAAGLTPLLRAQLVHVAPGDPLTIAVGSATLIACALAACLVPAYRATRVAPAVVLRHE